MRYLALDLGEKHTGVAYLDTDVGIPYPLTTLEEKRRGSLLHKILALAEERGVKDIVLGLPLLPSGGEGKQAQITRKLGGSLSEKGFVIHLIDERYTSTAGKRKQSHKEAALAIMEVFAKRQKRGS